ncbi:hypothetical protein GOBAR_AA24208 [Gossypium barbadense]|uniref:Protein kinase domain-containing protein n=1 Tax=Gossypium barbadense TaxID=3634 RepID=A0A2P5WZF0_GOSBA|nr:hypothetical protein GOBAR_AA24208 [Gossypium barbadense]
MMGTYDTLLLAFDIDNRVDEAGSLWNMVHTTIGLLQLSPFYIYAQAALECSHLTVERFNEIVGSPYYMALEVLKHNYGPEKNRYKLDFSCLHTETEQRVAQAIIRSAIDFKRDPWPKVSDNTKALVKKMLNLDRKQLLTAQEVLEHSWLQNAKKAPNVPLGETMKARLKQFSVTNKVRREL